MRIAALVAACVVLWPPALASEPGQPLDCSNFVYLEPGYSCVTWVSPDECPLANIPDFCIGGSQRAIDNEGRIYRTRIKGFASGPECGRPGTQWGAEILRYDGQVETVFAELHPQCVGQVTDGAADISDNLLFNSINGRLFVRFVVRGGDGGEIRYERVWWAAIDGFATTFEILQTYTPTADTFGFRVPYMPEGFQYADWFDSYYGDLATVGDWSQLQPLRCGYPATTPSVGDYFTVGDLPDPPPGSGIYVVTSVNHMGQRRYGRKSTAGALSGRDPALLPPCAE